MVPQQLQYAQAPFMQPGGESQGSLPVDPAQLHQLAQTYQLAQNTQVRNPCLSRLKRPSHPLWRLVDVRPPLPTPWTPMPCGSGYRRAHQLRHAGRGRSSASVFKPGTPDTPPSSAPRSYRCSNSKLSSFGLSGSSKCRRVSQRVSFTHAPLLGALSCDEPVCMRNCRRLSS